MSTIYEIMSENEKCHFVRYSELLNVGSTLEDARWLKLENGKIE